MNYPIPNATTNHARMTDDKESMTDAFEKWFFSDVCKHHSYEHELLVWQAAHKSAQEQQIKRDAALCNDRYKTFIEKAKESRKVFKDKVLECNYTNTANGATYCKESILNQERE